MIAPLAFFWNDVAEDYNTVLLRRGTPLHRFTFTLGPLAICQVLLVAITNYLWIAFASPNPAPFSSRAPGFLPNFIMTFTLTLLALALSGTLHNLRIGERITDASRLVVCLFAFTVCYTVLASGALEIFNK